MKIVENTKSDIKVVELLEWIPHRLPMIWIDSVTHFSEEGGECLVKLKKDEAYMDCEGLRASSLIEFMAQAHAFISICANRRDPNNKIPERAFLASIREAILPLNNDLKALQVGTVLRIQTSGHRKMGSITLFSGQVQVEGENEKKFIASAEFKVFSD